MRTQALKGFTGFFSWSSEESANAEVGRWKPMSRAVLPAAAVFRKLRRCRTAAVVMAWRPPKFLKSFYRELGRGICFNRRCCCGAMNGFANALVGAATADVAAHGVVNVGIGGIGFFGGQRDRGHDLAGLTVAALGNVFGDPGLLD